jgi:hypothetical protein
MHKKIWWRNLKETKHSENPGADAKITLKWRKDGWSWPLSQNMGKLINAIMQFNKTDLQLNKVDVDSVLLRYKAASLCNQFPVYRRIIMPSSSRSLNLYHPVTRRYIPEGTQQPHRCEDRKSGKEDVKLYPAKLCKKYSTSCKNCANFSCMNTRNHVRFLKSVRCTHFNNITNQLAAERYFLKITYRSRYNIV